MVIYQCIAILCPVWHWHIHKFTRWSYKNNGPALHLNTCAQETDFWPFLRIIIKHMLAWYSSGKEKSITIQLAAKEKRCKNALWQPISHPDRRHTVERAHNSCIPSETEFSKILLKINFLRVWMSITLPLWSGWGTLYWRLFKIIFIVIVIILKLYTTEH